MEENQLIKIALKKIKSTLTFLLSASSESHRDATIFETSPKLAFGFCPFMEAWVSRKKRAYADTGLKRKNIHKLISKQKLLKCGKKTCVTYIMTPRDHMLWFNSDVIMPRPDTELLKSRLEQGRIFRGLETVLTHHCYAHKAYRKFKLAEDSIYNF